MTNSKVKLSIVLAVRNEEENIGASLKSVESISDEIIVFDEGSTDKTRDIARKHGAKVYKTKHEPIFHITKQKAIDKARGEWILQLDADERVSKALASEISSVVQGTKRSTGDLRKDKLFRRHQHLIEKRDGKVGTDSGEVVAYFIPRLSYFVGKPLRYGGVYPDAVIRLFKRGKARLPAKSVHELPIVQGRVGWLYSDLEHHDSPTLSRYFARNDRYTSLIAKEYADEKLSKNWFNLLNYTFNKSGFEFLKLYLRHKAYKDGVRGFVWSLFSAWRFPLAYYKYWVGDY